jgi:large subunit ribosomal protein L20
MTRVKRGFVARKRRKKVLHLAEGFRGSSSVLFRTANQQNMKALRYSYRDRNQKKRQFRSLWIARLNAEIRPTGISYNEFIHNLKEQNVSLNRKILSQLALRDHEAFSAILKMEI